MEGRVAILIYFFNGRSGSVCNVLTDGNLGVGVGAASSLVKAHVNHAGSTGHIQMGAIHRNQSFLSFDTTYVNGYIRPISYMRIR